MEQDEAFEFFIEVKNKEIQELKDKLERINASSGAMINAGIKNRKRLTEIGDEMAEFMTMAIDTPHELIPKRNFIVNSWDAAKKGRNP
jgi:hypothetical protein